MRNLFIISHTEPSHEFPNAILYIQRELHREDNKYAGVYYEYKVARTSFFDEMHEICLKMPFVV